MAGLQTSEKAAEAAEVTAFWQELGLPGLVDVHTHFMPSNVQAKVWAVLEQAWPIAYRQPEADRIALLRAFGVCRFGALAYPHKPGMAAWLNAWQAEFAARTPEALHSATFFPEPGANGYVADAIAAGARLFKAHLQVGGYDPRDELLGPVWGLLAEARVPVVVHCGSGPTPGAYTGPGPFSEVLARHPRLITIVAHLGSPEYSEFLDLANIYPGVHLDTTMAFTDVFEWLAPFPAALRPRLAGLADRILLGSDFPNIPYPYVHQLQALARLDLGPAWLRGVCHDNAARLLGLSEPEGRGAAWTEERATKERATWEGGASRAPRRRAGKHSEPEGRGAAWTEERATEERATWEGGASKAPRSPAGTL